MRVWLLAALYATLANDALAEEFSPQAIAKGAEIFDVNCSPCHGSRMRDPQGAFNLLMFPRDEKARFINSVANGKNSMPQWGELFRDGEIEALWAYVMAGEKRGG